MCQRVHLHFTDKGNAGIVAAVGAGKYLYVGFFAGGRDDLKGLKRDLVCAFGGVASEEEVEQD